MNNNGKYTAAQINNFIEWLIDAGISDITTCSNKNQIVNSSKNSIATLDELKKILLSMNFPLKDCAKNIVFGSGNTAANILLLGEAPGEEEDKLGQPFVGASGQLLDCILKSINIKRCDVYITNVIPWRPPGNRTPSQTEIELFRPYVIKHISIVNPKIVVCLGGTATKALLNTKDGIMQLRGKWTKIPELINVDIIPTFHPAYLMRSPSQKKDVWMDFLNINAKLNEFK